MSALLAGGSIRTMARTIVHGPAALMGLEVQNLYATQGAEHIRVCLDHCLMGPTTGKLLEHSLEAMMIKVVGRDDVWKCPFDKLGQLALPSLTKAT